MRTPYTQEQIEFLTECGKTMNPAQITEAFNAKFNESRTKKGIREFMRTKGIKFVYTQNTWADGFTDEQKQFLMDHGSVVSHKKLTAMFNAQFGTNVCYSTIKAWCNRHDIHSPIGDGKFTSETSPRWQKGLSKEDFKSHYTEDSFDRMIRNMCHSNIKHNVGDEVNRHGKPHIIVNDEFGKGYDHRIQTKDRYIWEQTYGEIPEDHMIIHLDNDPMNCDISNLRCIPTKYRSFLAKRGWWDAPVELKETILEWCKLFYTIKDAS